MFTEAIVLSLVDAVRRHKNTPEKLPDELDKLLGRLPYLSHNALGQLCALVRDCSLDPTKTAKILGPPIILAAVDNPKFYSAASYLFEVLIENCELLFGVPLETIGVSAFGYRVGVQKGPNGARVSGIDTQTVLRRQHLKTFYAIRDKKYLPIVDTLFELHSFVDIAFGIYCKYKMLPDGWRYELQHMKYKENAKLDWFNEEKILFLTEEPMSMPPVGKRRYHALPGGEQGVEAIVDEIVRNETDYYEKLHTFIHSYVAEIATIAKGDVTEAAKESLGLTQNQVDMVFGDELHRCLGLSEKLLVKFEVLTLVPNKKVGNPTGRAGIVADVFLETSEEFVQALGPYNRFHTRNSKAMAQAEKKLRKLIGNRQRQTTGASERDLTYLEIWSEVQRSKHLFRGKEIDGFLIEPVRRCPNYIMFLGRLKKTVGESHPAYEKLNKAVQLVNAATEGINREIKKNDKTRS